MKKKKGNINYLKLIMEIFNIHFLRENALGNQGARKRNNSKQLYKCDECNVSKKSVMNALD